MNNAFDVNERPPIGIGSCEGLLKRKAMNYKTVTYRLGDMVRIKTGPFAAFTGRVEGINQSKTLLKVKVEIFGRVTPIKISFWEAEKVEIQPGPEFFDN